MKKLHLSDDLAVPAGIAAERIAVLGMSGGGKTYTVLKLMELLVGHGVQVIHFDTVGNAWSVQASADGKHAGLPVLVIGGDHANLPLNPAAGAVVAEMLVRVGTSAVLDVSDLLDEELIPFITAFVTRFHVLKKRDKYPAHIMFDESQDIVPEQPESKAAFAMRGKVIRLLKQGRNNGVGWTLASQDPQSVSKRALNQAGTVIAHALSADHDRTFLAKWASKSKKDERKLALFDQLPELPTGTALVLSPKFLGISKIVHIAQRETFDHRPPKVGEVRREPKVLAAPDIEKLKQEMTSAVAELEREDPKALQRRIRELEEKLKKAVATPVTKVETKTEIKEVPMFPPKQLDALTKALTALTEKQADLAAKVKQLLEHAKPMPAPTHGRGGPHVTTGPRPPPSMPVFEPPRRREPAPLVASAVPEGAMGGGERIILIAIAQHVGGVTREQLTVLTGYKRSTRDAYLQRLRGRGYVNDGPVITVTETGMDALGSDYEPLPTGRALYEHWLKKLPEGERRVLEVVWQSYPHNIAREAVTEDTGYKRSTRDAYLQRLTARRLVEPVGRGHVKASDELFDPGFSRAQSA